MKKHHYFLILTFFFFFLGVLLLNVPHSVGLADNTDFIRVSQPVGLVLNSDFKFFYFQQRFEYIKPFYNLKDFFKFVLCPDIENISGFQTTQFLFIKIAQLIDGIVAYLSNQVITYFNITILSLNFLVIHSISAALLFYNIKTKNKLTNIAILFIIVIIFYDMGYLLYYNSFFGESVILSTFLMWFSTSLHLIQSDKKGYPMLILYFITGIIFIGAKVANIPLGIIMALLSICFIFDVKENIKKLVVTIGIIFTVLTSIYFYQAIPTWMTKPNTYHSLFFGILKDSNDPENDLQRLGIDTKYATLAGTTAYDNLKGFDIYNEQFQYEVFDKAGPLKVMFFYLSNPGKMIEKLNKSAEASLIIRPPYLGNYEFETNEDIVKFAKRNSIWEWIRKQFTGYAFILITSVFLLYFFILAYQFYLFRKKIFISSLGFVLLRFTLMIFAASQWIFPVIGNGEADLIKHMFLFNLLFDTMIIMLIVDTIKLVQNSLIKKQIVFSIMGVAIIAIATMFIYKEIPKNKCIVFGQYKGQQLTWEILHEADNLYLLVAKDIVENYAFSLDNNSYWIESDIRQWLNDDSPNGFLYEFSDFEKTKIATIRMTTILSPAMKEKKQFGSQPHHWFCIPGYTKQNYDTAYRVENTENVFLLSIEQWEKYNFKKKKDVQYWLRTPYTMNSTVRIVGEDGYIYHKKANMTNIGVLPAIIIQTD